MINLSFDLQFAFLISLLLLSKAGLSIHLVINYSDRYLLLIIPLPIHLFVADKVLKALKYFQLLSLSSYPKCLFN